MPAPVAPAMRMCGIVARFIITALPLMSRPTATSSGCVARFASGDARMSPRATIWRSRVGHLDADRLAARDRRQDAHVGRRHRVGDVLVEARDPGHLHAGAELELVAGDRRAHHHARRAWSRRRAGRAPPRGPGRPPRRRPCRPPARRCAAARSGDGSFHGDPLHGRAELEVAAACRLHVGSTSATRPSACGRRGLVGGLAEHRRARVQRPGRRPGRTRRRPRCRARRRCQVTSSSGAAGRTGGSGPAAARRRPRCRPAGRRWPCSPPRPAPAPW